MDRPFDGINALITGSSRGIGLAVAQEFGRLGANVMLNCDKSAEELSLAVSGLKEMGINAFGVMGDVSDYNECERVFTEFCEKLGEIDVLVNNAGVSSYGLFTDLRPEDWRRLTEINVYSVFNCCRIAAPGMVRRKAGRVINISSVWGERGASCEAVYSASKGAVNAFTKALAKELAPSGVYVNAIACGFIDTKMNERFTPEEREDVRGVIGLMRFGEAEDVAKLCVYLAQTDYMTGQVLTLDGCML